MQHESFQSGPISSDKRPMSQCTPIAGSPKRHRCLIIGCGGHGRVVLDVLLNANQHEVIGFVDSNPALTGKRVDGMPVLGRPDELGRIAGSVSATGVIVAIGDNGVRRALAHQAHTLGLELINAVHPSANLARNVTLGTNIVVAAGALVCAHCQIGDSVILNTGCIVDHESFIGTATHVCPGARLAGRVTVESGAFVGIGATVIQHVRIGYESVIGAGAVVITDVAPMTTVAGVPAKPIHSSKPGGMESWGFADQLPFAPETTALPVR